MIVGLLALAATALWITLRLGRCARCSRPLHSVETLLSAVTMDGACSACRSTS